jgi:D-alanyl-D-alanine dipeptidase
MPNTANYSFPTPADTDLVKNGADAIRDLGDAVDTAMNTALGTKKSGLVLLNTTSFSAVSSVSAPASTFTTTYDMYMVKMYIYGSTTAGIDFRLRAAGTDNTSSSYAVQRMIFSGTTVSASRATTTSAYFAYCDSATNPAGVQLDIYQPATATKTYYRSLGMGQFNNAYVEDGAGTFTGSNAFDSLTIFPSAGTITGVMSVYGYNK